MTSRITHLWPLPLAFLVSIGALHLRAQMDAPMSSTSIFTPSSPAFVGSALEPITIDLGTFRYPCLRVVHWERGGPWTMKEGNTSTLYPSYEENAAKGAQRNDCILLVAAR